MSKRGLPLSLKMRHDEHYVDALTNSEGTPIGRLYDAYSSRALPFFGRVVARDAEAYRYLHESIRRFPPQRELARRMRERGFANVAWRDMTLGVVALHSGWRV